MLVEDSPNARGKAAFINAGMLALLTFALGYAIKMAVEADGAVLQIFAAVAMILLILRVGRGDVVLVERSIRFFGTSARLLHGRKFVVDFFILTAQGVAILMATLQSDNGPSFMYWYLGFLLINAGWLGFQVLSTCHVATQAAVTTERDAEAQRAMMEALDSVGVWIANNVACALAFVVVIAVHSSSPDAVWIYPVAVALAWINSLIDVGFTFRLYFFPLLEHADSTPPP